MIHNLNNSQPLGFDYSFLKTECLNNELEVQQIILSALRLARRMFPQFQQIACNLVKQLKMRHRDVHRGLVFARQQLRILLRMFKQLREGT